MEIWIPLISACVGRLIATVPVLIGLGIQIYIHVGERQQKEREAKIQTKEKWIERDILRIMNGVEKVINLLMKYRNENMGWYTAEFLKRMGSPWNQIRKKRTKQQFKLHLTTYTSKCT